MINPFEYILGTDLGILIYELEKRRKIKYILFLMKIYILK
jgi:hypothetical protein